MTFQFVVDVDDCVANFVMKVFQTFGQPRRWQGYNMDNWYPDLDWRVLQEFIDTPESYEDLRPVPGAKETLWVLKTLPVKILYFTARKENIRKTTVSWLRRNGYPDCDKVYCFGDSMKKMWEIAHLEPFAFIDDKSETVEVCRTYAKVPLLYDRRWNTSYTSLDPYRMLDWNHVQYTMLRAIENER